MPPQVKWHYSPANPPNLSIGDDSVYPCLIGPSALLSEIGKRPQNNVSQDTAEQNRHDEIERTFGHVTSFHVKQL